MRWHLGESIILKLNFKLLSTSYVPGRTLFVTASAFPGSINLSAEVEKIGEIIFHYSEIRKYIYI